MPITRKVRPEIMDSVALLVLDAQDCFIDTLHNKETFLKRSAFAIEAARCFRLHTIFTEQAPEKLGRTNKALFKLAHNPRVFAKQSFSALNAPGIERYLREKEIYHLLIVGLETPICVYQTALQATEEDVDVTFLVDALGSRRREDDQPTLDTITRLGCQILPSEAVFYSLLGDVQNPYFRAFNQIVKAFNQPDFDLETYLKDRPEPEDETEARPAREPRERRDQRPPRSEEKPAREAAAPAQAPAATEHDDNDNEENQDAEQGERRSRRRRRRRGRGRDRDRDGSETRQEMPDPAKIETGSRSAPADARRDRVAVAEAKAEIPAPSETPKPKPLPSEAAKPEAVPATSESGDEPAKKKAPAKKAPKKATKRAAKKTVRKTAKKAAKKTDEESAPAGADSGSAD